MKGMTISLSIFLLFSALLLLTYTLSDANTRDSDALTEQAAIARVSNQFDGIKYGLSMLPNASFNYTINSTSSFILTERLPLQVINGSGGDFLAFKKFLENYSYTNTSINISDALPLPLLISPQNISVIQSSNTSVVFQPLDNSSGRTIANYTIDIAVNNSPAPTIAWNPLNNVSASSSDALLVMATARVAGGASSSISAYINKSMLSKLEFTQGSTVIANATFNGTSLIGGLNISATPSTATYNSTTTQMLANANFSANDNNWTKTAGADSTIAWYNSGRTGGSENVSISGKAKNNDDYIAQNVTAAAQPSSGTIDWCYSVTLWSGGTNSNLSVYLRSPGGTGLGTKLDNVSITGTTAWTCRSASIPSGTLNSSGTYLFTAQAHLETTSGGTKYISVLLDDFQLNFTTTTPSGSGSGPITVTATMNSTLAIDRVSGGVVPSNITVSVGNEFNKSATNG
jgi:hypothetical protein